MQGVAASSGGSGGGQNGQLTTPSAAGTAGQGFAGGVGTGTTQAGGGGGGASAIGANGLVPGQGGAGGAGRLSSITGNYYAGGGGGGGQSGSAALGGIGGGGNGELSNVNPAATSGQANTGGGGGAMFLYNAIQGGNGGSGIIVISYYSPQTQYIQATGGTLTRDGDYLVHTFTSSSTLNITNAPSNAILQYLVVGGGGSGGAYSGYAGGGGAGGFLTGNLIPEVNSYSVIVGAGGAAQTTNFTTGNNGSNSSVFGVLSIGGGGGGGNAGAIGASGGSGGGSCRTTSSGGAGTTGQGNNGGFTSGGSSFAAGGGGGAGTVGSNGFGTSGGGDGGSGLSSAITGSSVFYSGGGGGGGSSTTLGGLGGGGNGGPSTAISGIANSGGGGGAALTGAAGGSGIVIVKYLSPTTMGPYTLAFYNEVIARGGTLTAYETSYLSTFEASLSSNLAEFDRLYIHGLSNNIAARTSFVNPSTTIITAVNGPTFTPYLGYRGNGTTSYLDTNYNPLTQGVKYTLNNASGFSYIGTNVIGGAAFGTYNNVNAPAFLYPQFAANQPVYYINSIATGSNGTGNSLGLSTVNRTGSAALNIYKNGLLNASSTVASSAIPSLAMFLLGYNNNGGGLGSPFAGVTSLNGFGSSNYNQATLYNSVISLGNALGWSSYTTAFKSVVVSRGGTLTTAEEAYLRTFETSVGSDLAEFDRLYIHGLSNSIAARTSFVNPDSTIATEVNAPTFTANRGYQGNGTTSYLNTNFNPSTQGVKYTQSSASLFVYSRTNVAANYIDIGAIDASNKSFIAPKNADVFSYYPTNLSTSIGSPQATPADSLGLYQTRLLSGVLNFYKQGVAIGSLAMTPVAIPTVPFYLLAGDNTNTPVLFSARQISVSGMGSGLIKQLNFYNAVQALGTSIGWAV